MREYKFSFYGSAGTRTLEFTGHNMTDENAKRTVLRSLAHYWPTYDSAAVWCRSPRRRVQVRSYGRGGD